MSSADMTAIDALRQELWQAQALAFVLMERVSPDTLAGDLRQEAEKIVARIAGKCRWVGEENDEYWSTSCDSAWVFEEGDPTENGVEFCPFCGKAVVIVPFVNEWEEEDDAETDIL